MISLYDVLEAANGQLFGEPAAQIFADFSLDSRQPQESHLYVALKSERGDGHQYMEEAVRNGATGILCTTPPTFDTGGCSVILVKDPQTALLDWARYVLGRLGTRVILVAGTTDQSVAADAIGRVLTGHFAVLHRASDFPSRLALPLALARLNPEHEIVVLGLHFNQPGDMADMLNILSPFAAVIPQIQSLPLDQFANHEQIADEYRLLLGRLPADGLAVLNNDDELALSLVAHTLSRTRTVSIEHFGADLMAYNIVYGSGGTGFDLRSDAARWVGRWVGRWTPLLGRAQLYGVLQALAVGLHLGVPLDEGLKAIKDINPLPGRMHPFIGLNRSLLIDDTSSAEPETVLQALDWLAEVKVEHSRTIVILGDVDPASSQGQRLIGQRAAQVADVLITEGTDAAVAGRAALDEGMDPKAVSVTHSIPDAITRLTGEIAPRADDIVFIKGGVSAQFERIVEALLNDPQDAHSLARHDASRQALALAQPLRPSWVEVDLDALAQNVRGLKALVGPDVTLNAVVKADGYGAGAVAVARTALINGADHLAVANIDEALELREAGISAPILILSYTPPTAVREALKQHLTVTVYDPELARAYERAAREAGGKLKIHVKIDTGMGRLGILPGRAVQFFRQLLNMHHLEVEGIYTHFSMADEDQAYTREQVKAFQSVVQPLRASGFNFKYVHVANSAGTLASKDYHFNMVRVGLAMQGLSPSADIAVPDDFRPVLTWKTFVAQVKTLPPGHAVGYGNTYRTTSEEQIAVLPVGYADGYRRGPANWGFALVHGEFAPIVGRVSMEKTMLNVSRIPDVAMGDEVVLLGAQGKNRITADDVARQMGTINYEVLCSVLPRIPRR